MIEIRDISIGYEKTLFDHTSIQLSPGKITLIHGASGTGKSTLLYIIGMLLRPKGCHYYVDNQGVDDESYRHIFSYVLQTCDLIDYMSVKEHFDMVNDNVSEERMREVLLYVDLDISLSQLITTLSSGEKQRLAIAMALIHNTDVILLDEPTAYLDDERGHSVLKLLKKIAGEGKTVVISSHDSKVDAYADVIYEIQNQKIIMNQDLEQERTIVHMQNSRHHYYLQYIKAYVKHHKVTLSIMSILSALCIMIMMTGSFLVDDFLSQQDQNLQLLSTNQVLLVNEKDADGYDDHATILDQKILDEIKTLKGISNVYSYTQKITSYQDLFDISLVSYISTDDFKDYLVKDLSSSPYYISEALYRVIKSDTLFIDDQMYKIGGVIDDDYPGTYLEDMHYVVYTPLVETNQGNYIVTFDDYKDISGIASQLEKNYSVSIITKTDTSQLLDSFNLAQLMGNTFCYILIILVTVLILIISLQLSMNQKQSFVYLKINAPNYRNIEYAHFILLFIQSIITFIIYILMQILFIYFLNSIYNIHMSYLLNMCDAFVLVVIYTLLINLPVQIMIHTINPVKILRKDN